MDTTIRLNPPSDHQIESAQAQLGFRFPDDYIDFIKSGYDMGESILEALEIGDCAPYLNIFLVNEESRNYYDLSVDLLPIVEDNSDYHCLNTKGEIVFWSHNGSTDEKWPSFTNWRLQMIKEACEN